jgi:hypothetical protein
LMVSRSMFLLLQLKPKTTIRKTSRDYSGQENLTGLLWAGEYLERFYSDLLSVGAVALRRLHDGRTRFNVWCRQVPPESGDIPERRQRAKGRKRGDLRASHLH